MNEMNDKIIGNVEKEKKILLSRSFLLLLY